VDLSSWTAINLNLPGGQGNGSWVVSGDNLSVVQTQNSDPSVFLNGINETNYTLDGTWEVETTSDDDMVGFVFGYQDTSHFYVMDWKELDQFSGSFAEEGFSVKKIAANSFADLEGDDFWNSAGTANSTILDSFYSDNGWVPDVEYEFTLDFAPGQFEITVKEGATVLWNTQIFDNTYTSGQFGFYNYSQSNVRYAGFTQEVFIPEPDVPTNAIPEPATMTLLGAGMGFIGWSRRRKA
jgi:hypothetical protein